MDLSQLHFAHPIWLWIGALIPVVWLAVFLLDQKRSTQHQLEKFIDKQLLPFLLVNHADKKKSLWKTLLLWSFVWSCLTLALAGPRWSFREMETFSQDQSLIILLDLSESMNATDVKPSRLIRAKQKIEDLLNLSKGVKIGLVAFAADSHMIAPITEDKETIRHLLTSLDTDLVYVQGSRLTPALDMAATMLEAEPGSNKALLVISDGGFEDASAIMTAKKLAEKDIAIHVMGVGTAEGAPVYNQKSKNKTFSKLEKDRLNEISKIANGRYLEAHFSDQEEASILKDLEKGAEAQMNIGKKNQFWDEHFYLMILPTLPIILWWFGRGRVLAILVILLNPTIKIEAANLSDYFKNSEELGKQAMDGGDYEGATTAFQDPYRKGVACYKAGNFSEAEQQFRDSTRDDVSLNAAYNLGNALAQQNKLKEAISAYEEVLKKQPDHIKAKENLELVKKMLEQQKQDDSNSENSDQQENQNEDESQDKDKKDNKDSKESKDKDQSSDERQQPNENDSDDQSDKKNDSQTQDEDQEKQKEQNDASDAQKEEKQPSSPQESREEKSPKSQEDQDADLWLNRIENDPKNFLKNKFYIESKKNGTKEGIDPW